MFDFQQITQCALTGVNSPTIQLSVSELHGDQEQIRMTGHIILIRAWRSFNADLLLQ